MQPVDLIAWLGNVLIIMATVMLNRNCDRDTVCWAFFYGNVCYAMWAGLTREWVVLSLNWVLMMINLWTIVWVYDKEEK